MQNAEKMCIFPTPLKSPLAYIYLAEIPLGEDIFYKIGKSRNLKMRLKALRGEHYCNIKYLAYGITSQPKTIEEILHIWMSEKQYPVESVRGYTMHEYYHFDMADVDCIIAQMQTCTANCVINR